MNEKDEKDFLDFQGLMTAAIEGHDYVYGDSWKTQTDDYMEERLKHKVDEYLQTKNIKKLISIANFAMLQFIRKGGIKK